MRKALGAGVGEVLLWAAMAIGGLGVLFGVLVAVFGYPIQGLITAVVAIFIFGVLRYVGRQLTDS